MSNNTISPIINCNALSVLTLKQQIKSLTETLNQQSETLIQQMKENGLNQITIEGLGVVNLKDSQERLIEDISMNLDYSRVFINTKKAC